MNIQVGHLYKVKGHINNHVAHWRDTLVTCVKIDKTMNSYYVVTFIDSSGHVVETKWHEQNFNIAQVWLKEISC